MRTALFLVLAALPLACANGGTGGVGGAGGSGTSSATTGTGTTSDGGSDTWNNYAVTFFATYCVECHNPNDPARDYNKYADVMNDAANIRCGVAATHQSGCGTSPEPKQFPISDAAGTNPKPSDAERARIVAWIDDGTPP